jgi:SagB-type dehydrogenase family enzyme
MAAPVFIKESMYIDFSKLFHRATKDIHNDTAAYIREDASKWPESWKTIVYKVYELLPHVALSKALPAYDPGLFSTITERKTAAAFSGEPITHDELSALLRYSCGELPQGEAPTHRAYPSAGPQYPLEAYVLVLRAGTDLPAGVYHYNVRDHALECLSGQQFTKTTIEELFAYSWVNDAAVAVLLTGVFARATVKYGQRGYRYTLLEAGHIGQNVYLVSEALGIKCRGMGGTYDIATEQLLGIDGENESVLYSLILGK